MKIVKILLVVAVVYVAIVAIFETLIGTMQPQNDGTLVITTTDDDGNANDRVLSRLEVDGKVYVAVNHWPRAWYHNALDRPQVKVAYGEIDGDFLAVPVEGAEHDRVEEARPRGALMTFLMGFAPRYFIRLEPA